MITEIRLQYIYCLFRRNSCLNGKQSTILYVCMICGMLCHKRTTKAMLPLKGLFNVKLHSK